MPNDRNDPHQLPALPYDLGALAPLISRETLEYHHGKHHRAYVTKLNELIKGTEFESAQLPDIVRRASGAVFNNAAQAWNHTFYWQCLSPSGGGEPGGELSDALKRSFGSMAGFAKRFEESALGKFGSGWTWLVADGEGALSIRNGDDAENPLRWNLRPLLTCDVWEHAYYIDYRNERAKYITAFWKLVNWDFVLTNLRQR